MDFTAHVASTSLLVIKPQPFVKGTILRGEIPESGALIRIYERSTGLLLNTTISNADGSYYSDVDCESYVYVDRLIWLPHRHTAPTTLM